MGFFDELFGKKKEDDNYNDIWEKAMLNQKHLEKSANYNSVFYGLKTMYFSVEKDFASVTTNKALARDFLRQALDLTKRAQGIRIPESFYNMPIHIYPNKGIVFEVPNPNPRYECECNYVALVNSEPKKMYTNEYFETGNSYGFCCSTESEHMILSKVTNTLDDFIKETIGVKLQEKTMAKIGITKYDAFKGIFNTFVEDGMTYTANELANYLNQLGYGTEIKNIKNEIVIKITDRILNNFSVEYENKEMPLVTIKKFNATFESYIYYDEGNMLCRSYRRSYVKKNIDWAESLSKASFTGYSTHLTHEDGVIHIEAQLNIDEYRFKKRVDLTTENDKSTLTMVALAWISDIKKYLKFTYYVNNALESKAYK